MLRYLDAPKVRHEDRGFLIDSRTREALEMVVQKARCIDADRAAIVRGVSHRDARPWNEHFHEPLVLGLANRVMPDAVPVAIELVLVRNHRIAAAAAETDGELISDLPGSIEIDEQMHGLAGEVGRVSRRSRL